MYPCNVIVHPTQCCIQPHFYAEEVVHVHPIHIQHQNHLLCQHKHVFPVTQSQTMSVCEEDLYCGHPIGCGGYGYY
ncbi:CotD family spore coat protein [Fictibacillus sp. Mic-4]|uniref:CotD family spore coat protein n=1 Tax=Fictibacillus TaxID=1329200 RepID=UPI00047B367B|nr:CotD family spore coat protein [Fictibacillus gelatini]